MVASWKYSITQWNPVIWMMPLIWLNWVILKLRYLDIIPTSLLFAYFSYFKCYDTTIQKYTAAYYTKWLMLDPTGAPNPIETLGRERKKRVGVGGYTK